VTDRILDRQVPQNLEFEAGLVGGCLIDPTCLDKTSSTVEGRMFFDEALGVLYDDLQTLHLADKPIIDPRVLTAELKAIGHFEKIGGVASLYKLIADGPAHTAHCTHYAKEISRLAELRRQIEIGTELVRDAYDFDTSQPAELAARAQARLSSPEFDGDERARRIDDISRDVLESLERPAESLDGERIYSGVVGLDNQCGPWLPGELLILAARTSIGKTALAIQIALHNAQRGRPTLFVSLEMRESEITQRLLCALARVDSTTVRSGSAKPADLIELARAAKQLHELPLYIWAPRRGKVDVSRIAAMARRVQLEHGMGCLVVDYLQLIRPADFRNTARHEQVAQMTRDLKQVSGSLGVVVLCLCQLSRMADKDGVPMLHHLRESGAIEQDADHVLFIHREDRKAATGELIVAKHRFGRVCNVSVDWDAAGQRYDSQDQPEEIAEFSDWDDGGFV